MSGWAKPVKDGSTHSMLKASFELLNSKSEVSLRVEGGGLVERPGCWILPIHVSSRVVCTQHLWEAGVNLRRSVEKGNRECCGRYEYESPFSLMYCEQRGKGSPPRGGGSQGRERGRESGP